MAEPDAPALPLARARARLQEFRGGRPGRPRTAPEERARVPRTPGRPRGRPRQTQESAETTGALRPPLGLITPRLLDLEGVAHYVGQSVWTVKAWLRAGLLRRTPLPTRSLRVDVRDVDALVERWKAGPPEAVREGS